MQQEVSLDLSGSGLSENNLQKSWDNFWEKKNTSVNSWTKRRIIDILRQYTRRDINVLDAGCGTGFFSSYFISCGCSVYSVDYSDMALSMARRITENKAKAYVKIDILKDALDVKFDIIFTDGLLEHYTQEEQDRIMLNMKGMKKEKGYLMNFVPNRYSLWSMVRPFYMRIREKPFLINELIDLHRRNGLSLVSSGGISVLPFRFSPEKTLGRAFGMLFYCIAA